MTHPFNTTDQHNASIHPLSAPSQINLLTHPTVAPYKCNLLSSKMLPSFRYALHEFTVSLLDEMGVAWTHQASDVKKLYDTTRPV